MTASTPSLSIVEMGDLPQYPIPKGERLASHSFFLFHYDAYLNSDFFLTADWEIKGIAQTLVCRAQDQDPVGTLPNDPRLLAALLGMSVDQFEVYCRRSPGPLYNWTQCLVGNTVRLMHPMVTHVALEALGERTKGADRHEADKERQRIKRLKAAVTAMAGERFGGNEMYVAQLDAWLEAKFPTGNRTTPRIMQGMEALGTQL